MSCKVNIDELSEEQREKIDKELENYQQYPPFLQDLINKVPNMHLFIICYACAHAQRHSRVFRSKRPGARSIPLATEP